ncbi:MAG: hypothetical protein P4L51_09795 [Puia sp.]|nr:hypothetical protein [Puia sp.]
MKKKIVKKLFLITSVLFLSHRPANAQERLPAGGQIPILAWYGIPENQTTLARYQEMKDAGITYQLTTFSNADAMQKALDIAAKVGIKLLVSCPELKSEPEKTARRFMNHPAVAGYHLMDEPALGLFPELANLAKKIQSVDGRHFCYVNLFPNIADSVQLGTSPYLEYVREATRQIPLSFLSFDYYPVLKERLSRTWYENLEQISAEAKRVGKAFWAFALSTNYDDDHLTPQTLASLRLQVYSDLAYGAQGIEYFTYWSATSINAASIEDQRGAPITAAGKRSVVYDRVKQMSEEIKNLSGVFFGSKVVWVRHTAKGMIPSGTIRLTALPDAVKVLETNGAPALVSLLENGENYFLVVVNKDFLHSMNLVFYGNDSVRRILKDGTIVPSGAYENSMEVDPGDATIYMFPKTQK